VKSTRDKKHARRKLTKEKIGAIDRKRRMLTGPRVWDSSEEGVVCEDKTRGGVK